MRTQLIGRLQALDLYLQILILPRLRINSINGLQRPLQGFCLQREFAARLHPALQILCQLLERSTLLAVDGNQFPQVAVLVHGSQLADRVDQPQLVVLPVDGDHARSEFSEHRRGHRLSRQVSS